MKKNTFTTQEVLELVNNWSLITVDKTNIENSRFKHTLEKELNPPISYPKQLFNKMLNIFPQIIMGGSLALYDYGLLGREPGDLDINVDKSNLEFIKFAKYMQKLSPVNTSGGPKYLYQYTSNHIRFNIGGINVCVFICDNISTTRMESNSLYSKLSIIIEAKYNYYKNGGISKDKHKSDLLYIIEHSKNIIDLPKNYFNTEDDGISHIIPKLIQCYKLLGK